MKLIAFENANDIDWKKIYDVAWIALSKLLKYPSVMGYNDWKYDGNICPFGYMKIHSNLSKLDI